MDSHTHTLDRTTTTVQPGGALGGSGELFWFVAAAAATAESALEASKNTQRDRAHSLARSLRQHSVIWLNWISQLLVLYQKTSFFDRGSIGDYCVCGGGLFSPQKSPNSASALITGVPMSSSPEYYRAICVV